MQQKIAFITGSSSGIGKSIAQHLLQKHYKVYATARQTSDIQDLIQLGAIPLTLDVTDHSSITKAFAQVQENEKGLDILINNAGYGQFGVFEYITDDQAKHQFEVNVFGLAAVTRAALPLLRKSTDARIINISSIAAHVSLPFGGWYSASKFAVEALTSSLRLELKTQGIKLISLQPGPIQSNFGKIMRQQLVLPKPDGVYDEVVKKAQEYLEGDFQKTNNNGPDLVVKAVWKAIISKSPKTTYRVTPIAHLLVWLKRILPTKALDFLFLKQMGI